MYAAKRLTRAFAVAATLLMLFMVAASNIAKAASADPFVASQGVANATNETPPPPSVQPPIPPDPPQRNVEPGTITQGWDNSTFSPTPISEHREPTMKDSENQTLVETTYGNFALNKNSPYFVRVSSPGADPQEIAESSFVVMSLGQLLTPADGVIDNATDGELSFHYGLYMNASLQGTMTVDYRFYGEENKIAVSFSP